MNNKFKILVAGLFLITGVGFAQTGIGTITPDASAVLDVTSTTKGLLVPRHTTSTRDAIVLPAKGLVIFNTSMNQLQINSGTASVPNWVSAVGTQGPTGPTGPTGPQGQQGALGPQGFTGATGPQGVQGIQGETGADGISAYQVWLNAGNTGTQAQFLASLIGAQGPQGIQGVAGASGATGATGAQGPQGLTGATGATGPQGAAGADGISAYQVWLNAGNTGTQAQFLASLVGPQGPQGIQGADGATGPQGPAGTDASVTGSAPINVTSGVVSLNDAGISTAKLADGAVTMAKINQGGAASGQVMKWNGSTWSPADDDNNTAAITDLQNTVTQNYQTLTNVNDTQNQQISNIVTVNTQQNQQITSLQNTVTQNYSALTNAIQNPTVTNTINGTSLTTTVNGTSAAPVELPTVDGSETKVTAGTNVTVTGTGTTASPYIVNATVPTYTGTAPISVTAGVVSLNDAGVTTNKLADAAVTTTTIADNAVTVAKLPSGATATTFLQGNGTWANQSAANTPSTAIVASTTQAAVPSTNVQGAIADLATAVQTAGSNNIYTSNGTLSGNRTVTQGTNTLAFTSTATTGTSQFTVDGTTLNVDAVNNRVGIGTATPTQSLEVIGNIKGDRLLAYGAGGSFNNTAVGYNSLLSNTTGDADVAIGANVLPYNTTGNYNTGVGAGALSQNTTGGSNVAIGYSALSGNTTGGANIGIGYGALRTNTTGGSNIVLGQFAGRYISDGSELTNSDSGIIIGNFARALGNNQTNQTVIGNGATGIGNNSVVLGNDSVATTALKGNVGIGNTAPTQKLEVNGNIKADRILAYGAGGINTNSAIGLNSLYSNTTGSNNSAIGYNALLSNTTGSNNAAIGYNALQSNTTASSNLAMGSNALQLNTIGEVNVGIGANALLANTTGSYNTGIGAGALSSNTTGASNIGLGYSALSGNTTGGANIGIGYGALRTNTTGGNNIVLGQFAGRFISDGSDLTNSDSGIIIGNFARALGNNQTNQTVIGNGATGIGNNSVVLGNDSVATTALKGNVGIGTTTPTEKLDVTGNVKFSGALMPNNTAGTTGQILTSSGAGAAPTWATPTVASTIYSIDGTLSGNRTVTQGANNLAFTSSATTGTSQFTVDGTTLNVDAVNNRVGIGTATPSYTFDVLGNSRTTGTLFTSKIGIGVTNPFNEIEVNGTIVSTNFRGQNLNLIGGTTTISFKDATYTGSSISNTANDLNFVNNDNNGTMKFNLTGPAGTKYYWFNGGNLGIGTTGSPTQALDVAGNVKFSGALMPNNTAGTDGQVLTSSGAGLAPTWKSLSYFSGSYISLFGGTTGFSFKDGTYVGSSISNTTNVLNFVNNDNSGTMQFNLTSSVGTKYYSFSGGNLGVGTSGAPTSTIQANGTFALNTATTGTENSVVLLATGTFTPPTASTVSGRIYIIRNTSAATNVSVASVIDYSATTATTFSLTPAIGSVMIISDGASWYRIK